MCSRCRTGPPEKPAVARGALATGCQAAVTACASSPVWNSISHMTWAHLVINYLVRAARINDAHGRAKKDEQGSEEIHGDFFDERKEESIDRREGGRARALRWRVQPGASVSGK